MRIWTNRPYFKENLKETVKRLSAIKQDDSEHIRKSVDNALRDISKKYSEIIESELSSWDLDNKEIK